MTPTKLATPKKEAPTINNLKRLREEAPLSIRELAALAGVSHNTVWRLEAGLSGARPSTVRKLARALDVRPKDLALPPFGQAGNNSAAGRRHRHDE